MHFQLTEDNIFIMKRLRVKLLRVFKKIILSMASEKRTALKKKTNGNVFVPVLILL